MLEGVAAHDQWDGLTVADVMLRRPKSLPSTATVAEVRAVLANPSVQMVLLADHGAFAGAIAELPDEAPDDEVAVRYADERPESIRPTETAEAGFALTAGTPNRRVVVLDEAGELHGLLCLDQTRTRFCGGASHRSAG
jgi:hypothetical protein